MQVSVDLMIRQKFVRIIDSKEEAEKFGEEAAEYCYSFSKGFGDFEYEYDDS